MHVSMGVEIPEPSYLPVAIDRMGFLLKRGIWVEKIEWTEGNEISSVESI